MKNKLEDIIPGTFDPVFKEIFTSPDCHNFVCALISEITKLDLNYLKENLKVINSNLPKSRAFEKTSITDVLLSVDGNILNIEMNNEYYKGLFEKNDMYQHTILSRTMKREDSYLNLKKVIQINIDNFSKFKKAISIFKLMEIDTHEIENKDYIKYHIALPKIMEKYYNGDKLNYLEKLLCVIGAKSREELSKISKGDMVLMEASKKIEDLSLDELFSDLYDVEKDRIMAENAKQYRDEIAEKRGMRRGMKKGMQQGMQQGIQQGIIETAKKMLKEKIDIDIVSRCTGLSKEKIELLK